MNPITSNGGAEENANFPDLAQPGAAYPASAEPLHDASAGNVDKIRDILFGTQMRDYEQRFSRLEEALRKESQELRDTTRRHLDALEAFVHKELAALEARLNTEREERAEGQTRLTSDLSSTSASIFRKIGEFENQEAQAKREIRNDLLQRSKELSDAIQLKGEELVALLERRSQELQHAKTDRAALASLFSEVSLRLTDQFKVTGAD
ncbi:MAG TPA: hypothetical protein VMU80_10565 [Bryobacteraceae bacterium]|nr:hypothetical protein [Bryobacteraceae bacterium]HUO29652.1 hypothetical protein [Bryobacteraceae bacterium]